MHIISVESEGAEKIEKNEINDDLNYNFPDNETLILDGCFFCPLMIDYEVKSIDIWRMYPYLYPYL
jgi:hypothetical protein